MSRGRLQTVAKIIGGAVRGGKPQRLSCLQSEKRAEAFREGLQVP